MILGTAGHVDHGKTALVRALTGVDTDRLPEEKRRGITIELGFAPLRLGDDAIMGVVDVPGHESFVRTMVAGATGIDLALLVVAADEGVMPQTREHVDILRLLGTRSGVIALTKCDLVDAEWIALVEDELRAAVARSPLARAPIVRTSAVTGEGLDTLRAELRTAAEMVPSRPPTDVFRLPVDRAFSVHGTGTVVTGTTWSGMVERDARVFVLPGGARARLRAIESHGVPVERAVAGMRAALALGGVDLADVPRGSVIVGDPAWRSTVTLLAEVTLLDSSPGSLAPRRRLRLHLGTQDVEARVVTGDSPLAAGERRQCRVVLSQPVVARAGDRFVLRAGVPITTIGGGVVNDPLPGRPRSPSWPRSAATPLDRFSVLLELEGELGLSVSELPIRLGCAPVEVEALLASHDPRPVRAGERIYAAQRIAMLHERVLELVDAHHAREPLDTGVPVHSIRADLRASPELADRVIAELAESGALRLDGALVARRTFEPKMTAAQEQVARTVLDALRSQGRQPATVPELERALGPEARPILRQLERQALVTQVEFERYYERTTLAGMISDLRGTLEDGSPASPAALRDALGISRKFLIPFLEYCDLHGITERSGEGRVLRKDFDAATKVGRGSA